jgi:DNA-binding transcriptional regulator YdaS (Cro superfamily)
MTFIERAAQAVGSRTELAKRLSVTRSAVSQWEKRKRIPASRVLEFEQITGISRHELRPDIFGERE